MAAYPQAAERLAVEDILAAIVNSPLSGIAEQGSIAAVDDDMLGRSETHRVYCLTLAVVARLASALRSSAAFTAEVQGFVRLISQQMSAVLRWSPEQRLSLPLIEEFEHTVALYATLAPLGSTGIALQLTGDILAFLNTLLYCLQHPNTLASSLQPSTQDERTWLQSLADEPSTATDGASLAKRPVTAALMQSFLQYVCQD